MKSRRTYTQRARADAAAETRQRILDAAIALLRQHFRADIHLEDIAEHAGVSVQTIMRIFGNRATLLEDAGQALQRQIRKQRSRAAPGSIDGAIAGLFDHYEEVGDLIIHNLAAEADPSLQPGIIIGREAHREWVEHHFGPQLTWHLPPERDRVIDALVCACDVYIWKILRRDMGRSRAEAEATMIWMVTRLVGEH